MSEIRNIGSRLEIDGAGYFVSPCNTANITKPWQDVVDGAIAAYRYFLKDKLVAVYVRGSIVRGTAVAGVSDVDTFAVVSGSRWQLELNWIEQTQRRLADKCDFDTSVEMQVMTREELSEPANLESLGFTVKVLSACVWGEDVSTELPPFGLGNYLLKDLHELQTSMASVSQALASKPSESEVYLICQWLMKVLVRAGYCLVMPYERAFTRDLYPCFEGFCRHYPAKAELMSQALQLAIYPCSDKERILNLQQCLGTWLLAQANACPPNLEQGTCHQQQA